MISELVSPTSETETREFVTERLQLAIYLHAAQRLPFSCCNVAETGKVRFVFMDVAGFGPQAELEFDRGAEVAATDLFASQKFLRRKMTEEINKTEYRSIWKKRIPNQPS